MFRCWPLLAFAVAVSVLGCSKAPEPVADQSAPVIAPADGHEMAHGKAPALSTEDQALADKQKLCPVCGEALGSMGHPVKVMVGDRAVFLCCAGCKGAIEANPEKYLAKLDAAAAAPGDAAPEATTEGGTSVGEAPAVPTPEPPRTEAPTTETPAKPE